MSRKPILALLWVLALAQALPDLAQSNSFTQFWNSSIPPPLPTCADGTGLCSLPAPVTLSSNSPATLSPNSTTLAPLPIPTSSRWQNASLTSMSRESTRPWMSPGFSQGIPWGNSTIASSSTSVSERPRGNNSTTPAIASSSRSISERPRGNNTTTSAVRRTSAIASSLPNTSERPRGNNTTTPATTSPTINQPVTVTATIISVSVLPPSIPGGASTPSTSPTGLFGPPSVGPPLRPSSSPSSSLIPMPIFPPPPQTQNPATTSSLWVPGPIVPPPGRGSTGDVSPVVTASPEAPTSSVNSTTEAPPTITEPPPGAEFVTLTSATYTSPTYITTTSPGGSDPTIVPIIIPFKGPPVICFKCFPKFPPNIAIKTPEFCIQLFGLKIGNCPPGSEKPGGGGGGDGGDKPDDDPDGPKSKSDEKSTASSTSSCTVTVTATHRTVFCSVTRAVTEGTKKRTSVSTTCITSAYTTVTGCSVMNSVTTLTSTHASTTTVSARPLPSCTPGGGCSGDSCKAPMQPQPRNLEKRGDPANGQWVQPGDYYRGYDEFLPLQVRAAYEGAGPFAPDLLKIPDENEIAPNSLPVSTQWIPFGDQVTSLAINTLGGCTAVILVSRRGAWACHIWEDSMKNEGEYIRDALDAYRYRSGDNDPTQPYNEYGIMNLINNPQIGDQGTMFGDEYTDPALLDLRAYILTPRRGLRVNMGKLMYVDENNVPLSTDDILDPEYGKPAREVHDNGEYPIAAGTIEYDLVSEDLFEHKKISVYTRPYNRIPLSEAELFSALNGQTRMEDAKRVIFDHDFKTPRGKALIQYRPATNCEDVARWRIWYDFKTVPMAETEWEPTDQQIFQRLPPQGRNPVRRQAGTPPSTSTRAAACPTKKPHPICEVGNCGDAGCEAQMPPLADVDVERRSIEKRGNPEQGDWIDERDYPNGYPQFMTDQMTAARRALDTPPEPGRYHPKLLLRPPVAVPGIDVAEYVMSEHLEFRDKVESLAIDTIYGCTIVVIMSRRGAIAGHFWESTMRDPAKLDRAFDRFRYGLNEDSPVFQFARHGIMNLFNNPSQGSKGVIFGDLRHDNLHSLGLHAFIITPRKRPEYLPERTDEWLQNPIPALEVANPNSVMAIVSQLNEIFPGNIRVTTNQYVPPVLTQAQMEAFQRGEKTRTQIFADLVAQYHETPTGKLVIQYRPARRCSELAGWRLFSGRTGDLRTVMFDPEEGQVFRAPGAPAQPGGPAKRQSGCLPRPIDNDKNSTTSAGSPGSQPTGPAVSGSLGVSGSATRTGMMPPLPTKGSNATTALLSGSGTGTGLMPPRPTNGTNLATTLRTGSGTGSRTGTGMMPPQPTNGTNATTALLTGSGTRSVSLPTSAMASPNRTSSTAVSGGTGTWFTGTMNNTLPGGKTSSSTRTTPTSWYTVSLSAFTTTTVKKGIKTVTVIAAPKTTSKTTSKSTSTSTSKKPTPSTTPPKPTPTTSKAPPKAPPKPEPSEAVWIYLRRQMDGSSGAIAFGETWMMMPFKREQGLLKLCETKEVGRKIVDFFKSRYWPESFDANTDVFGRKKCKYKWTGAGFGTFRCEGVDEFPCKIDPQHEKVFQCDDSLHSDFMPKVRCWFPVK